VLQDVQRLVSLNTAGSTKYRVGAADRLCSLRVHDGIAGGGTADAMADIFPTLSPSTAHQPVFTRRFTARCQEVPALELFAETTSRRQQSI